MIGPNMATMLALVITDAALTPGAAQSAARQAVADSFNCIASTATGTSDTSAAGQQAAGGTPLASEAGVFSAALRTSASNWRGPSPTAKGPSTW